MAAEFYNYVGTYEVLNNKRPAEESGIKIDEIG